MIGTMQLVWAAVRPTNGLQRWLWWIGLLLLVSSGVHGVIALVDGSSWDGPVSWRKPVLFAESFGLLNWTLVWMLRQLPRRWWVGTAAGAIGTVSLLETALIVMQRWRGQPSHFNHAGTFNTAVWGAMGTMIMVLTLATVVLLVAAGLRIRGSGVARVGMLAGLVGILVAGYVGKDMAAIGEAAWTATGHVPAAVHFGAAGSAKLAHAVGLHGAQVLALLAVALDASPLRHRMVLALAGAAGYAAMLAGITLSAYAGQPWQAPSPGPGLLTAIGAVVLLVVGLASLRGLWIGRHRDLRPGPPQRPELVAA